MNRKFVAPKLRDFVAVVGSYCPFSYKKAYEDVLNEKLPVWPHTEKQHYRVRVGGKLRVFLHNLGLDDPEIDEILLQIRNSKK